MCIYVYQCVCLYVYLCECVYVHINNIFGVFAKNILCRDDLQVHILKSISKAIHPSQDITVLREP